MTKEQLKAREELKRITGIWIIDNNEELVLDDSRFTIIEDILDDFARKYDCTTDDDYYDSEKIEKFLNVELRYQMNDASDSFVEIIFLDNINEADKTKVMLGK